MIQKIRYYSFQDILKSYIHIKEPSKEPPKLYPNSSLVESGWFAEMLTQLNLQLEYVGIKANGSVIASTFIAPLIESLMNVVSARHLYDYLYKVIKYDNEAFDEDSFGYLYQDADLIKAITPLLNTLQLTMPKYIPILYQYTQNYEIPLDKIESISEAFNRFNDTPQNEQDEVDFNTDDYATSMGRSKAITKADTGSLVERIRALQDAWKSVLLEWANEFNDDFIYENQLEEF